MMTTEALNRVDWRLDGRVVAREGVLAAVKGRVCAYVRAIPGLEGCVVVVEDGADVGWVLALLKGGMWRLAVVVAGLGAVDRAAGAPGALRLDPLAVGVCIWENPAVGGGVGCMKAAELVAGALKLRRVGNSFLRVAAAGLAKGPLRREGLLLKAVGLWLTVEV